MKELNEEIECMKGKEFNSNKQLDKIYLDLKENEKTLLKIDKSLEVYADKVETMVKEIKEHSELITTLQDKEKANAAISTGALENINTKVSQSKEACYYFNRM